MRGGVSVISCMRDMPPGEVSVSKMYRVGREMPCQSSRLAGRSRLASHRASPVDRASPGDRRISDMFYGHGAAWGRRLGKSLLICAASFCAGIFVFCRGASALGALLEYISRRCATPAPKRSYSKNTKKVCISFTSWMRNFRVFDCFFCMYHL